MNTMLYIYFSLAIMPCIGWAAPFQNLGFDDVNTNHVFATNPLDPIDHQDRWGPIVELLPGWQLGAEGWQAIELGYDLTLPGLGYATIVPKENRSGWPVIGEFALQFVPYVDTHLGYIPFSLTQSGEIPADAKSIRFVQYGAPVQLEINGSLVPLWYSTMYVLSYYPYVILANNVASDISAFAGQEVELKITTIRDSHVPGLVLDDIFFSPEAIPEPRILMLLIFGSCLLSWRNLRLI